MKKDRLYLVTDGKGDIFALTPEGIDKSNDKGADFRLIKIDKKGRTYIDDCPPTIDELYKEEGSK